MKTRGPPKNAYSESVMRSPFISLCSITNTLNVFSSFGMTSSKKRRRRELLLATYARSVSPLPDDPSVRKEQGYYTKFSAWGTSRRATDWDRNLVLNPSGQRLLAGIGNRAHAQTAEGVVL